MNQEMKINREYYNPSFIPPSVSAQDSGDLATMLLFILLSNLDCNSRSAQMVRDH